MSSPSSFDPKPELTLAAAPPGQKADAATAPRGRVAVLLRWLFPLICLFQTSLLVSWLLVSGHGEHAPAEDHAEKKHGEDHGQPQQVITAVDAMSLDPRQGETLLREGNFAAALAYFWPSTPAARAALPDVTQFKAALCLEALGYWPEALEAYRAAVSRSGDAHFKTAGQVAQARIHVRMVHPAEAKCLLFPLLLTAGQSDRYTSSLLIEARYLLGLALSQQAFAEQKLPGLEERPVRANTAAWQIGHTLEWLAPVGGAPLPHPPAPLAAGAQKEHKLPDVLEVLRPYGPKSEEVLLRGTAKEMPSTTLLEKLAGLSKLQWVATPQALLRLQEHTASLALDGVPLMDVVQGLLDPQGLSWQVKEGALHVGTEAETPKDTLKALRASAARQALRQAMFAGPDHPLAATAYLELGNDEAVSGKFDEAVSWYERLLAESSRSPHLSAAYFNLGLVQRARRNQGAARKAFYRVVDRDPAHELAPLALVQVGWTYLTEGQHLAAIFPLRQAVSLSQAPPADAEAIIALGAAYLLNGNALEANSMLSEGRTKVNRDPWRITVAFLDALARHRVAAASSSTAANNAKAAWGKSRMEAADLLAALLAFQNRPTLGVTGQLLAGQAYKELGMPQQMGKVYEDALPAAAGAAAAEMSLCLAEQQWSEGKRESALKLFATLATPGHGKWGLAAQLRLATITLSEGQPQQCLAACTALLHEHEAVDRQAVLRLMGTAYEQLGDFQKAAQCFSGEVPD